MVRMKENEQRQREPHQGMQLKETVPRDRREKERRRERDMMKIELRGQKREAQQRTED